MTIDETLKAAAYKPTGFDYMRLILASGVIAQHSVNVSDGAEAAKQLFHTEWRAVFAIILPMFFSLSGFLVAGSLFRCRTLVSFMSLRILRLGPALAGEVILSAIIIGPFLTTYSVLDYVRDDRFPVYFLNIVGYIHYELPGVFAGNPWPNTVNLQLWTIPYELKCYLVLAGLALTGLVRRRLLLLLVAIGIQTAMAAYVMATHPVLETVVSGRILVFCFVWGIVFYCYRDKIPMNWLLFVVALLATIILLSLPGGDDLVAIPACYVTVYLGLLTPRKPKFLFSGDYSYGMYLYGFPIQQLVASISPDTRHWYVSILLSIPAAFLVANLSWRFIESPALSLKSRVPGFEERVLSFVPGRVRDFLVRT